MIYTDVWGPSPLCSTVGNKYYVSFLDVHSRYTWLFTISLKSDVCIIFLQFQKYVEQFFNSKIKIVQSDWGSEYRSLSKLLQNMGISHRLSCPHTQQQNGVVEHKHHHIVETGLALISHAHVPTQYWDDAFQTTCFLINRMPTLTLKNYSPYEILFRTSLNYSLLRVFGCVCWPNLRPYNSHKLQPHSIQCVFLGYSLRHKGYRCLNSITNRIYISRDVVFEENIFPFSFVSLTTPQTSIPTSTSHSPQLSILFPQNMSILPTQRLVPPNPHSPISTRSASVSHQSTRLAPALSRAPVVPHFLSLPSTPASSHTSPPMSSHV